MNNIKSEILNENTELMYGFFLRDEDAEKMQTDKNDERSSLNFTQNENGNTEIVVASIANSMENDNIETSTANNGATMKIWPHHETLTLIEIIREHYDDLHHPTKRKYVWDIISNSLHSLNISVTSKECHTKYRNLLRSYKAVKHNKNKTGRGCMRFQYFTEINDLLSNKRVNQDVGVVDLVEVNAQSESSEDAPSTSFNVESLSKTRKHKQENLKQKIDKAKLEYLKKKILLVDEERERRKLQHKRNKIHELEKLRIDKEKLVMLKRLIEKWK